MAADLIALAERLEQWRPVVGYEGRYEVSDQGRVRSLQVTLKCAHLTRTFPGKVLKAWDNGTGALIVSMIGKTHTVHKLVAAAFIGPRPEGTEVAHNDGNATNNAVSNLRYATKHENEADKVRHGTATRGERCPWAKLTAEQVAEIRSLSESGARQKDIAAMYGVSTATVHGIKAGRKWKHL